MVMVMVMVIMIPTITVKRRMITKITIMVIVMTIQS